MHDHKHYNINLSFRKFRCKPVNRRHDTNRFVSAFICYRMTHLQERGTTSSDIKGRKQKHNAFSVSFLLESGGP